MYISDGEDPDSFAKKTSHDDLVAYLDESTKTLYNLRRRL
jgi:DNA primase